jgi:rhodanese-related sulfurtransferase
MGRLTEILSSAQERARTTQLPYEGTLTPSEALEVLQLAPGSRLIDVRSRAELDLVGKIPGAVEIEWMTYPGWHPNPHFLTQLKQQVDAEALTLFICRNGQRSHKAAEAATLNGYRDCYNVLEGFEGDLDRQTNQRGKLGGWKTHRLPWIQN